MAHSTQSLTLKHLWIPLLSVFILVAIVGRNSEAEEWPTLPEYVNDCVLIVKARTVVLSNGSLTFRVIENWKGTYDPSMMARTTTDGRFFATPGEHGVNVFDGQEIIFFFTRHNQPNPPLLSRHSTAFPIVGGQIIWASTSDSDRRVYTVRQFQQLINSAMRRP